MPTIVVSPAFDGQGKRRHGRFNVRLQSTLEIIREATKQPLLDSARVLLSRGCDPNARINMIWHDKPKAVSLTAVIGQAAQFDVMAERFVRRPANPEVQRPVQIMDTAAK